MTGRFAAALLAASLLAHPADARDPAALTLEALMEAMAQTRGMRARFHERKEISLLAEPVESSGLLYFVPPDRFARHTLEPGRSVLVIEGDALRLIDATAGGSVDLSADPVARQFARNFAVLFNGDLAALRERYQPTFRAGAEADAWELVLEPRSETVREFLRVITLRGRAAALEEMVWVEADGDRTVTRFDAIETDRAFDDAELERAFPGADAPRDSGSAPP